MPAAAVIPAPIAYIKVVAVKKLVVGFRSGRVGLLFIGTLLARSPLFFAKTALVLSWVGVGFTAFTLKKLECSKQAFA